MRRIAAIVVVVALGLVACSDDDPAVDSGEPPSTTALDGNGDAPEPVDTTPDGQAVIPPTTRPTPTTTGGPPPDGLTAAGPIGSFAPAYLRPGRGDRIIVEVATQPDAEPRGTTLDHVTSVLASVSDKKVTLSGTGTPPQDDLWTGDEARAAVDAVSTVPQGDDAAVLRLLFVHGRWAADENVLGVALRADAAMIFIDGMREAETPIVGAGAIEVATTTHEVGHLLGLVDLHLSTGRADPEHPGHSPNRGSVMYWAVESTLVTDLLAGGPPRDFDSADLADLATIRGGA